MSEQFLQKVKVIFEEAKKIQAKSFNTKEIFIF